MFSTTADIAREIHNWIETKPDPMPKRPPRYPKREKRLFPEVDALRKEPALPVLDPWIQLGLDSTETWGSMRHWPCRCPTPPLPPGAVRPPRNRPRGKVDWTKPKMYILQDEPGKPVRLVSVDESGDDTSPAPQEEEEVHEPTERRAGGRERTSRRQAHIGAPRNPYAYLTTARGSTPPEQETPTQRRPATARVDTRRTPESAQTRRPRTARTQGRLSRVIPPAEMTPEQWRLQIRLNSIREHNRRRREAGDPPTEHYTPPTEEVDWSAYTGPDGRSYRDEVEASWRQLEDYMEYVRNPRQY